MLFVIIVVYYYVNRSKGDLYTLLADLQPISIILAVASLIVIPLTIGMVYWKKTDKSKHSGDIDSNENLKSSGKSLKGKRKKKNKHRSSDTEEDRI